MAAHPARSEARRGARAARTLGRAAGAALVFAAYTLAGCGGGRSFVGGEYRDAEARYHVGALGGDWAPLDVAGQNDLAWRSARLGAIVQANATCDPASDAPLTALTAHLLIGFTERAIESQALVAMDGREALRTRLVARLDGVTRQIVLVVLKKDGCVYDLSLVAAPGPHAAEAEAAFDAFVAGFTTERR